MAETMVYNLKQVNGQMLNFQYLKHGTVNGLKKAIRVSLAQRMANMTGLEWHTFDNFKA